MPCWMRTALEDFCMAYDEKLNSVLEQVFKTMPQLLDERQRRLLAASIAKGYGYGGIKLVSKASGMDTRTIRSGIREIENNDIVALSEQGRVRSSGAGRKSVKQLHPELLDRITEIVENNTYGDPQKVISWTNLSLRDISSLLKERFGIEAGKDIVSRALEELGYSKQANQKMMQVGDQHVDRDAQFQFINKTAQEFIDSGEPVISTDTKKKELVGNFKNNGTEYRPVKDPRTVLDHDFALPELGKVAPYGVYLVNENTGFVNLGSDHDTSAFAVESIRRWWNIVGQPTFPNAKRLYINCDGGGSNGWRMRLWKYELALLAEETGLEIHVSHFPPGTSKWNKVEHRLFCYITKNWAGKPLIDIDTIVSLISSTTTKNGLTVKCVVDTNTYPIGLKATDEMMSRIDIETTGPNESWNYIIRGFK